MTDKSRVGIKGLKKEDQNLKRWIKFLAGSWSKEEKKAANNDR